MGKKKSDKAIQWNTKKDNCIGWESEAKENSHQHGALNFLADET